MVTHIRVYFVELMNGGNKVCIPTQERGNEVKESEVVILLQIFKPLCITFLDSLESHLESFAGLLVGVGNFTV